MSNLLPRSPGRPKGSKNKIPADLRAWINHATALAGSWIRSPLREELQKQGLDIPDHIPDQVVYFAKQAMDNPQSFNTLVSKIIPREVTLDAGPNLEQILTESWGGRAKTIDVEAESAE